MKQQGRRKAEGPWRQITLSYLLINMLYVIYIIYNNILNIYLIMCFETYIILYVINKPFISNICK